MYTKQILMQILMVLGFTFLFSSNFLKAAYVVDGNLETNLKKFIEEKQKYITARYNNIDTRLDQLNDELQKLIDEKNTDKLVDAKLNKILESRIQSLNSKN